MNELYEVPVIFDKKIYVEQELNNAKINFANCNSKLKQN